MLPSLLLLASCAVAEPPAVSTGPAAIAVLVSRVQRDGERAVFTGDLAGFAGVDDPTTFRVRHFPKGTDGMTHSVFIVQDPTLKPAEQRPKTIVFVTRRAEPGLEERHFIRIGLDGKLLQATGVRDRLDDEGALKAGGRYIETPIGKKAQDWLDHEVDYYFRGRYRRRE